MRRSRSLRSALGSLGEAFRCGGGGFVGGGFAAVVVSGVGGAGAGHGGRSGRSMSDGRESMRRGRAWALGERNTWGGVLLDVKLLDTAVASAGICHDLTSSRPTLKAPACQKRFQTWQKRAARECSIVAEAGKDIATVVEGRSAWVVECISLVRVLELYHVVRVGVGAPDRAQEDKIVVVMG